MSNLPPIPVLIAIGLFAGVGYLLTLAYPKMLRWPIMLMLFASSCMLAVQPNNSVNRTILFGVQANRPELMIALGFAASTAMVAHLAFLRRFRFGAQTVMLLLIAAYMSLIRIFHYGPTDALQTAAMALVTLPAIAIITSGSIQKWEDFYTVFRLIPVFALVYIGMIFLQSRINYSEMTLGKDQRFSAFTGNPQHAAAIFGPLCGMLVFALLNEPVKFLRLVWLATLGGCLLGLLATQSRTGLIMAVLTTSGVLYQRIGTAIFLAPILGVLGIAGLAAAQAIGVELGLERFISTENTRSESWQRLWESAMASPIIGSPYDELTGSENSLLNGFAAYGVGMFLILIVFMIVSAFMMLALFRNRSRVPKQHRQIIDVIMGYNAAYFAGAMLEGYMVSRIATSVIFINIFAAMGSKILMMAKEESLADQPLPGPSEWQHEWADPDQLVYTERYTT